MLGSVYREQLTSRRTCTCLLKAASRSALSSTGQYLGEQKVKVLGPQRSRSQRERARSCCERRGSPLQGHRLPLPVPPTPGRAAEARGGKVVHHRDIEEVPGRPHHQQQRLQVPRAAVRAEHRRRGLLGVRGGGERSLRR